MKSILNMKKKNTKINEITIDNIKDLKKTKVMLLLIWLIDILDIVAICNSEYSTILPRFDLLYT